MQDLTGHSIGRYHILEPLGQGGMASVYKAFDTRLEAEVAVKVIRTDMFPPAVLDRMLKRFEREAKAVARLNHPNIVSVIDYGEHEGFPYLVMKYMPGGTLKAQMGQPMPYNQAARLLAPIARSLAYAHGEGVLHRDVKPANILITQSGEPVLTDFGIAKLVENEKGQTLTGTGMGIGTPEYMAPEQGLAQEVDGRADVYALGVVFYELVTGRRPFVADTPMAVLLKQVNDPLPRPKDFVSSLPRETEQVILKALAKNPADRYKDMTAFATALEKLAAGSTQQDSQTMLQRARKKPTAQHVPVEAETFDEMDTGTLSPPPSRTPRRGTGKWILIGIAIVVLIGTGVYFGLLRQNQPAVTQSEPIVVTQVVTPATIVKVIEPTKTIIPTLNQIQETKSVSPTNLANTLEINTSSEIVFSENFESGKASGFSPKNGVWQIVNDGNNKVYQASNSASDDFIWVEFGPTDFSDGEIQYKFRFVDFDNSYSGSGMEYIFFRTRGGWNGNAYTFQLQATNSLAGLDYVPENSSSWASLGYKSVLLQKNQWYVVRVEANGYSFKIYLDGKRIISGHDSQSRLSAGRIGFQVGPRSIVQFDDVEVASVK